MATNCLVTKLKATVNNSNLEKLGYFKLTIDGTAADVKRQFTTGDLLASASNPFIIRTTNSQALISVNNDRSNPVSEWRSTSPVSFKTFYLLETSGTYEIEIFSKYTIDNFQCTAGGSEATHSIGFDISAFKYNDKIATINVQYARNVAGDLSSLSNCTALTNLQANLTNFTGDIAILKNLNLDSCKITGGLNVGVTGSVENLCNLMKVHRASGTMAIDFTGTSVIYNGVAYTGGTKTVKFGTSMVNPTEGDTARGWQIS